MRLGLGMKAKVHKQPGEDNPNSLYFIWYLRYNSVNLIIEIKFHGKFLTFKLIWIIIYIQDDGKVMAYFGSSGEWKYHVVSSRVLNTSSFNKQSWKK